MKNPEGGIPAPFPEPPKMSRKVGSTRTNPKGGNELCAPCQRTWLAIQILRPEKGGRSALKNARGINKKKKEKKITFAQIDRGKKRQSEKRNVINQSRSNARRSAVEGGKKPFILKLG